jgi:phosphoenolpyruvate carboxykinase (GTP)
MGSDGRFLWPGYGHNLIVLKWILDRCKGTADAVETPIGYVPTPNSLNLTGMNLPGNTVEELLRVDERAWMDEIESSWLFFKTLGEQFPDILWQELSKLRDRLRNPSLAPHN